MTLKIVQLNLGKNATATDELRYQAANDRIDIALVQEAYVSNSFLAGAGLGARVVKVKTQTGMGGGSVGAAIIVFNQSVDVVKLTNLCSQYLACVEVSGAFGSIYLVSAYFNFKGSTEEHLDRLKGVLEMLKGKNVLIAIDANAKSVLLGSKATDVKGE